MQTGRRLNMWACVILYVALIVWPIGTDNESLPCYARVPTKAW